MKKQSLIKGTVILGVAGIFARFLGLFFRWPLIMLIGDEGIGYYQMSYPLYMFFIAISSGIPIAVSKMISERNAVNDRVGIIQVLRKAVLMMIIIGGGFSLFFLLFSKQIVTILKWDQKSYYSLIGIAFAPIVISMMSVLRGFFQGLQNMSPTAFSQILEQVGRVVVGVGLAFILLPRGIEYSAGGAAFGAAAGGVLGGLYLVTKYIKVRRKEFNIKIIPNNVNILTKLLKTAIPISLGAAVGTVMGVIDSILVPQKLLSAGYTYKQSTILYGQLTGKAAVLVNIPLTLSMALSASIVPIIAEAYVMKRKKEVINRIKMAMKISIVIALPCFCGLFFMAAPILNMLFPGHADGYIILKYLSISIPFVIVVQTSTSILQSTGKFIAPVINLFLGCIAKIVFTNILVPIPSINIYGAVFASIIGYIVATVLNLNLIRRNFKTKINYYNILIKPAYASIIMSITVVFCYTKIYNNTMSSSISTLASILIGVIVYGIIILLVGVFKYSHLKTRITRYKNS